MPSVVTREPCTICTVHESVMHSHHTIPRSRGGEHSRQIILCSSCHNILHANALYIVSRLRNPKRPPKEFWKTEAERINAQPWLQILVNALVNPAVGSASQTEHLVGCSLDTEHFQMFKLLANDLGCSQENAVEYCIKYVLTKRGLKSEKTKPDLWFLPVPKS